MELTQEAFDKLQADLTAANGEAASRRNQLREAKDKLAGFDGIDPEKYQSAISAKQELEDAKLKAEGNFEKLLESKTSELQKIITQKDDQLKNVTTLREKEQIDGSLIASLARNNAHSPDELSILLRGNISLDDQGPFIKDADGSPMVKDGKRVAVDGFVSDWLAERPQYVKSGPSGSGSQGGKGKSSSNSITRGELDALTPLARASHFKGGGTVTD